MLSKKSRISNKQLISKLFKKGKLYRNRPFVFRFFPSTESYSRFASVVSTKVSKKAVDRNLLKRRITEIIRLHENDFPFPIVSLIILKPSNKTWEYKALEKGIIDFLKHLSLNSKELKTL